MPFTDLYEADFYLHHLSMAFVATTLDDTPVAYSIHLSLN